MARSLKLGLTAEQIAKRRHSIGGSDANVIMAGDPPSINRLWLEKTGREAPEDLSRVLPVQMGSWTEELNRYWYELTTGRLVYGEGEERAHAQHGWMTCTLDGATTTERSDPAIFEAKHVGGFQKIEDVVQRYMPQLHHNMAVCGVSWAVLSVFVGNASHELYEVEADWMYTAQLLDREREFWACVTENRAPHDMPNIPAPVVGKLRTVDMTGNNAWSTWSIDWLAHKDAAKAFDKATKELKALMQPDMGEAFGAGIVCKRAKNGSLSIREKA